MRHRTIIKVSKCICPACGKISLLDDETLTALEESLGIITLSTSNCKRITNMYWDAAKQEIVIITEDYKRGEID